MVDTRAQRCLYGMHEDTVTAAVLSRIRLADYLAGAYPSQERAERETWLAADPERQLVLGQLEQIWNAGHPGSQSALDAGQLWRDVAQQTITSCTTHTRSPYSPPAQPQLAQSGLAQSRLAQARSPHPNRQRRLATWLAAGAAVVGTAGIGLTTNIWNFHSHSAPHVYTTTIGERVTITLPDGSVATLAPSTTLTVDTEFGNTTRTLSLVGEAFFTVHNHDRRPFLVRAGSSTTRVLGTEFSIRHYEPDSTTDVSVLSGKVAVEGVHAPMIVTPGRVVRVTDTAGRILGMHDRIHYTDWAEGQLVFHSAPLPVLLQTMEQWYGYRFRVRDSAITEKMVTVRLKMSDAQDALNILKGLLDVDLRFDGSTITLSSKPHTQRRSVPRGGRNTLSTTTEIG